MQAAGRIHLAPRPLRLELEELAQLRAPCILHWDLNHFVVLKSVDGRGAVIHDPAFGIRRLTIGQLSKHFTGIALELTPTAEFQADGRPAQGAASRPAGTRHRLAQVAGANLPARVGPARPSQSWLPSTCSGPWMAPVVSADRDLLTVLGLGFLLLTLVQVGLAAIRSWIVLYLSTTLNLQWLANVFSHLLRLPGELLRESGTWATWFRVSVR
jgi:ATP-binding cassette subfamily B protein RaxB